MANAVIVSIISKLYDDSVKLTDTILNKLFIRKNIFYALLLVLFFVFIKSIKSIYDSVIVVKYLSYAKASLFSDLVMLIFFLLTILYFVVLYLKKRRIGNEFFFWTAFITSIYIIARSGNDYIFLGLDHLGLGFLYYADWIILFFAGLLFMKIAAAYFYEGAPVYEENPFVYDTPIQEIKDDLFGRQKFAEQLAVKIKSRKRANGSVAIGINGAWGSGKTSFLNMVLKNIDPKNRIIIRFEPWKCKSTTEIIKEFFELLIDKIESENKKLSFSLQEYADKLVELDENLYTQAIKSLTSVISPSEKAKTALYNEINREIAAIKKQIIIVIDDMDRLDKSEVLEVIRLIRNTADFNGVTFLTCYDKGYILNAIKELNEYNHKHYLEKIFQYEFVLPVFDFDILKQQLVELAKPVLDEIQIKEFSGILYRTINESIDLKPVFLKTQRDVIRFANSFFFEFKNLAGEVDMEDLFCIHLLKLKYQRIYELLIEQKELFFIPKKQFMGDDILRLRFETSLGKRYILQGESTDPTAKPSFVFAEYFRENKDSLELTQADLDLLENFIRALFYENSTYRKRFHSTNEIVYAQSFDKYFAYNLLKNNLSTIAFNKARSNAEDYFTYLNEKVKAKQAGPVMDKLFLVKEFKTKEEIMTHFQGLCFFANLVRKEPIFDIYHDNYSRYVNEIFGDVNISDDLRSQEPFAKKQLILYPWNNVPFFEYEYCRRNTSTGVFSIKQYEDLAVRIVRHIAYAVSNKETPAYPPAFLDAAELEKKIRMEHTTNVDIPNISFLNRVIDFWNYNEPADFGVLIKQIILTDRVNYTIDRDSPLFEYTFTSPDPGEIDVENVKYRLTSLHRGQEFTASDHIKELIDFLDRLKTNPSGINYNFKHLKPGEMQADHSNFKWRLDPTPHTMEI